MWSAGKLMRDVCLPKFPKVSVATADEIHNGNIPDDKDAKCYINCIMEMMQTVSRSGRRPCLPYKILHFGSLFLRMPYVVVV